MTKTNIKMLAIGESGSGKTYLSGTFPRSYWIQTEPAGYETIIMNPELEENTVVHKYFLPSPTYDLKDVFNDMETAVKEAHQMAKDGLIDTLILDNMSYLSINRWLYALKYEKAFTKDGELNKLAMYAALADYLYEFTYWYLTSFPGNVIVTCHEKLESDLAMSKKRDKSMDKSPDIVGSFRDRCFGLFSLVVYLDKTYEAGKFKYKAQTNKGNGRLAKNRYNLPNFVENISYTTMLEAIESAQASSKTDK